LIASSPSGSETIANGMPLDAVIAAAAPGESTVTPTTDAPAARSSS
jgi:hypothetical protein